MHLVPRDVDRLDVVLEPTVLGEALVTTPAQTLFDLLSKPAQGGMPDVAVEAVRNLAARASVEEFGAVIARAKVVRTLVRDMVAETKEVKQR